MRARRRLQDAINRLRESFALPFGAVGTAYSYPGPEPGRLSIPSTTVIEPAKSRRRRPRGDVPAVPPEEMKRWRGPEKSRRTS